MFTSLDGNDVRMVVWGESAGGMPCFIQSAIRKSELYSAGENHIHVPITRILPNDPWEWRVNSEQPIFMSEKAGKPEQCHIPLRAADAVLFLFDVTSSRSFEYVTQKAYQFAWRCRATRPSYGFYGMNHFGFVLVGITLRLQDRDREVSKSMAEDWAASQGSKYIELDDLIKDAIDDIIQAILKSTWLARLRNIHCYEQATGRDRHRISVQPKELKENRVSKLFGRFKKRQ